MTIKYRGRVDCYINPPVDTAAAISRPTGVLYTNIIQHFIEAGPELGIEMIGANYGTPSGDAGSGWNFWDQGRHPGQRSWACFRFHSASHGKFDLLIFEVTGAANTGGQNLGGVTTGVSRIGISCAAHPSGAATVPWNGGVTIGSATLGSPVWKTTTAGLGAFFPRANGLLGTYSASRNYMMSLDSGATTAPIRSSIILTEDSFTTFNDYGLLGSPCITHFGPILVRSGVAMDTPYFMFGNSGMSNVPFVLYSTLIGNVAGTTSIDGAVAVPTSVSGAQIMFFAGPSIDTNLAYNTFVDEGVFEKLPLWVGIKESANLGILGQAKHLSFGYGMPTYSVSQRSSSLALGTTTLSAIKLIIPWSGSAPNTTALNRAGRRMNFDL